MFVCSVVLLHSLPPASSAQCFILEDRARGSEIVVRQRKEGCLAYVIVVGYLESWAARPKIPNKTQETPPPPPPPHK